MKIFRTALEAGRAFPGAAVAIGKFDGVHRGHEAVLRGARREADRRGCPCTVLTFDPSPDQYLRFYSTPPILTTAGKLDQLKRRGVDCVVLLPFNRHLACISPEGFARDVLSRQLRAGVVFVGEDFCFGKDRAGRVETLEELGPALGFEVHRVPLVRLGREKISASRIRALIADGKQAQAERLLGRKLSK
ncbi:MAG: hypothetical protein HY553_07530 [Elusimicrobia bacterium]|nr:hypothetical protein [Elusimicrobiota bacterium]